MDNARIDDRRLHADPDLHGLPTPDTCPIGCNVIQHLEDSPKLRNIHFLANYSLDASEQRDSDCGQASSRYHLNIRSYSDRSDTLVHIRSFSRSALFVKDCPPSYYDSRCLEYIDDESPYYMQDGILQRLAFVSSDRFSVQIRQISMATTFHLIS